MDNTSKNLRDYALSVIDNIGKVIIGKRDVAELATIAIMGEGHLLIEDLPGVGKTMLARSLAISLGASFKRVQFVPDLLPSDIVGINLYNQKTSEFQFREGPIMANIVLADEINRTPPKTQAALLEAMQEHKVTTGGQTYDLDEPFFVLATQNPIEQEGTYPLPEAQLDRFMFNLKIDYPSTADEINIVRETTSTETQQVQAIMSKEEIASYQDLVRRVPVADNVITCCFALLCFHSFAPLPHPKKRFLLLSQSKTCHNYTHDFASNIFQKIFVLVIIFKS
jgi:MoxR-like ATPase